MKKDAAALAAELATARGHLAEVAGAAQRLSTPQHWTETDLAIVSGICRKRGARADARRYARFDREAAAWTRVREAEAEICRLERAIAVARRNEPIPYTADDLRAATFVRDRYGWHKVVRVNAKSVSVETGYSWVDRIAVADLVEVRVAQA